MTSYTPSTYYHANGTVVSNANVGRLTQYDTSDEIHFHHIGNVNRRFKFTISTNTWSDAHASNTTPFALSNGLTSTTPSTFGGDVSGTPQPAIIGMCQSTGGSNYGGFANPFYISGPTPDQYGRLPSTAVSKSVNLGRISYRAAIPGENVIIDATPTVVTGGYQTFNFPSAIFCPRPRNTFAEAETDRALFEANKQNYTRNGITYGPYIFGGCLPDVLDSTYTYVELRASAPFQFNSNGDWYVNYTTHAYRSSPYPEIVEIITGFSHNPAHSVLLRYNITTNTWISVLANIQETTYTSAGSIQYTNKKLTLQSVSPSSTRQWNSFSNLSNTTVNLIEFFVDVDTNIGSSSTPTQTEVEVATTTSNGGGKPDRYPLISTNLFDRQKSIFSIGKTHKDETLF